MTILATGFAPAPAARATQIAPLACIYASMEVVDLIHGERLLRDAHGCAEPTGTGLPMRS